MIGSILVNLSAGEEIILRGMGGEALHGLFFDTLKAKFPQLAANFHNSKAEKPFSLSSLLNGYELREGRSFIHQGGKSSFRLALLDEELLAATISAFFTAMTEERTLQLSGKPITIEAVDVHEGKLVSFSSFPKLLSDAHPQEIVSLEFLTPTSFKVEGIQNLFPEPRLVFSSLFRKWNAFSGVNIPQEICETFPLIRVSNYSLHTELLHFSKYKIIGFKGRIEYRLPPKSTEPFRQTVNALADFAFYAGTGAKTTMGMGQTRRLR